MKVIDILNKMANGTLEDGFEFKYDSIDFKYCKRSNIITEKYTRIREKNRACNFGEMYNIEEILNDEVEVIEEKKEIEEKLDWEEIIGSVGKPVWDNKRKKWRVLDYYAREKNKFSVSFSDTSYTENFEKEELYFKEIKESEEK